MGIKAAQIFAQAERLGGIRAKVALAVKARIPSTEVASAPDTPELLHRLDQALDSVIEQLGLHTPAAVEDHSLAQAHTVSIPVITSATSSAESRLRTYQRVLLELMSQRSLVLSSVETAAQRITESTAHTLAVERVSVWRMSENGDRIQCVDLYRRHGHQHSRADEIAAENAEPYFKALRTQRTIAAHDAFRDERTRCFAESYLAPLGISSMLDVPIWAGQRMLGVLCHEHVGLPRTWTVDEETFAYLAASLLGIAFELEGVRGDSGEFALSDTHSMERRVR